MIMEFSTLIGKPVLSHNGKSYGYAVRVYVSKDLSALTCILCADSEEEEFYLPAHAVQRVGDAIVAGKARLKAPVGIPCPVGRGAFDEKGAFLGGVSALTDGSHGTLTVVGLFGEREYASRLVLADEIVVIRDEPRAKKNQRELKREKIARQSPSASPEEFSYRTNLLGRRVRREIQGLALPGETVTCEMIRRAHETGRLLELKSNVLTDLQN